MLRVEIVMNDLLNVALYNWARRLGILFWTDYKGNAVYQAQLNGYNQSTVVSDITRPGMLFKFRYIQALNLLQLFAIVYIQLDLPWTGYAINSTFHMKLTPKATPLLHGT